MHMLVGWFAVIATLVFTLSVKAAPDHPHPDWQGASDDFAVQLFLTPDQDAFVRMWAKPTPPVLQIYNTAEVGTRVAVVLIYQVGHANAGGQCDLVSQTRIEEPDGRVIEGGSAQPICASSESMQPERFMLGRSIAEFVPDGEPRRIVVTATVTDRATGKALVVSAPLRIVAKDSLFHFESVRSIEEMHALIRQRSALGTDRATLRRVFASEGRATIVKHPSWPGVEKYVYDIDLCAYYIWRWNISADYDERGGLRQAYVNGETVFPGGTPPRAKPTLDDKKSKIFKGTRARPEASMGESSLAFTFFDVDGDLATIEDQYLFGAGPTRADPVDMGQLHVYNMVDPWRSIFDSARAEPIASYPASCAAADKKYGNARK